MISSLSLYGNLEIYNSELFALQRFNEAMFITEILRDSDGWEDVMHIVHDVGHLFNYINAASALYRAAKHNECQRVRAL